jgi:hypothetical protein
MDWIESKKKLYQTTLNFRLLTPPDFEVSFASLDDKCNVILTNDKLALTMDTTENGLDTIHTNYGEEASYHVTKMFADQVEMAKRF